MLASFKNGGRDLDTNALVLMAVGLLIVVAPLELGQLAFALVGSLCYAALQASRKSTRSGLKPHDKLKKGKQVEADASKGQLTKTNSRAKPDTQSVGKQEYRQVSQQPVVAPTFKAGNLESQVEELLEQIAPSPEGDQLVQDIAAAIKKALHQLIPEAEVLGFASGDVLRGTAFAVAIPEVDIILSASTSVFAQRLQNNASRPLYHAAKLDDKKLQKAMLRACTDTLTSVPGFKFRRSAFKGMQPKVTLMAELNGRNVPIDFSVNTTTPLHNAALLTECGQIELRAKELILLVRRWAKDRGISHAAKGHLSPYAWSLLAIYFLQVWDGQDQPVLPSISSFKMSSGLLRQQHKAGRSTTSAGTCKQSVAFLFQEFIRFYTQSFDWRTEAVSVRAGKRQATPMSLPLQIVTLENGSVDVAPSVQDPFETRRNLSDAMTGVTLTRLHEELNRAQSLCSSDVSLSELIEPWVPADRDALGGAATKSGHADEDSSDA